MSSNNVPTSYEEVKKGFASHCTKILGLLEETDFSRRTIAFETSRQKVSLAVAQFQKHTSAMYLTTDKGKGYPSLKEFTSLITKLQTLLSTIRKEVIRAGLGTPLQVSQTLNRSAADVVKAALNFVEKMGVENVKVPLGIIGEKSNELMQLPNHPGEMMAFKALAEARYIVAIKEDMLKTYSDFKNDTQGTSVTEATGHLLNEEQSQFYPPTIEFLTKITVFLQALGDSCMSEDFSKNQDFAELMFEEMGDLSLNVVDIAFSLAPVDGSQDLEEGFSSNVTATVETLMNVCRTTAVPIKVLEAIKPNIKRLKSQQKKLLAMVA